MFCLYQGNYGTLSCFIHAAFSNRTVSKRISRYERNIPMIDKNLIPHQMPGFMLEKLDDEVLLYHQVKTQAVYLNTSAAMIWALCNGTASVADMEELLIDHYPESRDDISAHLLQTLEQFKEIGAIELK